MQEISLTDAPPPIAMFNPSLRAEMGGPKSQGPSSDPGVHHPMMSKPAVDTKAPEPVRARFRFVRGGRG
jgi:hypothetical protein